MFGLGLSLLCATLFPFVAEYEHMTGWKWAGASLGVSVLWWPNSKRLEQLNVDRASRIEQDRRARQEHARQVHAQAGRAKDTPQ